MKPQTTQTTQTSFLESLDRFHSRYLVGQAFLFADCQTFEPVSPEDEPIITSPPVVDWLEMQKQKHAQTR